MKLKLIVAVDDHYAIGKGNDLLWQRDLPADLRRFRNLTEYNATIMGRKTSESILKQLGGPLPNRLNLVVTRQDRRLAPDGFIWCESLEKAIEVAKDWCGDFETCSAFVIGGGEIYRLAIPMVYEIYLTTVHHSFEADVFFPQLKWHEWHILEAEKHPADEKNKYPYDFLHLRRRKSA